MLAVLDPLKPQNQMQTLMVMRVIWREAINRGEAEENPAKLIRCPKIHVKPQKFLTWEEIKEIDFGRQTKRIRFLALHGLRYGEAAALTRDDISDGMVHINKSKYGSTKTPSGIRSVPLLSEFEPFPTVQVAIAHALRPYGVTVHSLRKTYAYTLKKSQIHITTAARMMGHSNPMITLKIYTQVLDSEIRDSQNAIRGYIDAV